MGVWSWAGVKAKRRAKGERRLAERRGWCVVCGHKRGTHLLTSRPGHLEEPPKKTLSMRPRSGRRSMRFFGVREISRFQDGQQPKLREKRCVV